MPNPSGSAHTLLAPSTRPARRLVQGLVLSAAAAAVVAGSATPALAAVPVVPQASGTTVANVLVESALSMTGLTPSFTLTGTPGATVEGLGAVSALVTTNNQAGYVVTVASENAVLSPADTTANPDTIPIGDLKVKEAGTSTYTSVSSTALVTVHTQGHRSAPGGDTITNDYSVDIPFVNSDTYSATLDYVATAL